MSRRDRGIGTLMLLLVMALLVVGGVSAQTGSPGGPSGSSSVREIYERPNQPPFTGSQLTADVAERAKIELKRRAERLARLQEPEAVAERKRSRDDHRLKSDADALEIARRTHPEVVDAPPWRAIDLGPDEYIDEFVGPNTVRVKRRGQTAGALVESSVPFRGRGHDGQLALVDLDLEEHAGHLRPRVPLTDVRIPRRLIDGIELPAGGIRITPAGVLPTAVAQITKGKAFWGNVALDTDLLAVPRPGGLQTINLLRSPAGPERLLFSVESSLGGTGELTLRLPTDPFAAVEIMRGDKLIGHVTAPKAWDADGTDVPVRSEAAGNHLVLTVDHRHGDFAYPIVVDPEYIVDDQPWSDGVPFSGWQFSMQGQPGNWASTTNDGYLGRGLWMWNPTPGTNFNAYEKSEWFFQAPGEAFVYRADFVDAVHEKDGSCLYEGLWGPGGWDYGASGPDEDSFEAMSPTWLCDQFYWETRVHCLQLDCPQTGQRGNAAVWDIWMESAGPRNRFTGFLGGSTMYLSDYDPPLISVDTSPAGWTDSTTAPIRVKVEDKGLGVDTIVLGSDTDPNWGPPAGYDSPCSGKSTSWCPAIVYYAHPVGALEEGVQTVYATATDIIERDADHSWEVRVDRSPPEFDAIDYPSGTTPLTEFEEGVVTASGRYGIRVRATDGDAASDEDARSGVRNVQIWMSRKTSGGTTAETLVGGDAGNQPCTAFLGSCVRQAEYVFDTAGAAEGHYRLRMHAEDQLGHATDEYFYFDYDRTPPTLQPVASLGWSSNPNGTATLTGSDGGLGIGAFTIAGSAPDVTDMVCEATWLTPCFTPNPRTRTLSLVAADEGINTLAAVATDAAGNDSAIQTFTAKVDTLAPDIALSGEHAEHDGGALNDDTVYSLDILATDGDDADDESAGSGVKRVKVSEMRDHSGTFDLALSSGDVACPAERGSCALSRHFDFDTSARAPGEYTLMVEATDWVGRVRTETLEVVVPKAHLERMAGTQDWFQFNDTDTGAGSTARVNIATGNLVWVKTILDNPGRGLNTTATVTYNSKRGNEIDGPYDQIGEGFSLGLSGVTRVNEPLDLSKAAFGIAILTDADGTRQQFKRNGVGDFVSPPGVHMLLRKTATDPETWTITRPNGVTHSFDGQGYERSVMDRNANELRFDYEPRPDQFGAPCQTPCDLRLTGVTDSAGVEGVPNRTVRVAYWASNAPQGAKRKIRTITDHAGRVTEFFYGFDGRLDMFQEARGTAAHRTFVFEYDPGSEAALLTRLTDPENHRTDLSYDPETFDVQTVTDRRGAATDFAFSYGLDTVYASVVDPLGNQTTYNLEATGAVTDVEDALGTIDRFVWDADHNLRSTTEAAAHRQLADPGDVIEDPNAATTALGYNALGQVTKATEPGGRVIDYAYRVSADGSVSDLQSITDPNRYTTQFELDPAGNVTARVSPTGGRSTTTYDAQGQPLTETDEVGNVTRYAAHDANGLAREVTDPRGTATAGDASDGRWMYSYDAVGNALTVTDPRGTLAGDINTPRTAHTTTMAYDALDRVVDQIEPKLTSACGGGGQPACELTATRTTYDDNDNVVAEVEGVPIVNGVTGSTGARTDYALTAMDEVAEIQAPATAHAGESGTAREVTRLDYDDAGQLIRETAPRGTASATAEDFSTEYTYDDAGRLVAEAEISVEGGQTVEQVTSYAYDRRGNVVGVADPETNAELGGDPVENALDPNARRLTVEYDIADRPIAEIEDPGGEAARTAWTYDEADNVRFETSPQRDGTSAVDTTQYVYDARGLLQRLIDPSGDTTEYVYRADGLLETERLPKGVASSDAGDYEIRYEYDPAGDLKKETLPAAVGQYGTAGAAIEYQRDAIGNPVRIKDARGGWFDNTFYEGGQLRSTDRPSFFDLDLMAEGDPVLLEREEREEIAVARAAELTGEAADEEQDFDSEDADGDFGAVDAEDAPALIPDAGRTTFTYDAFGDLKTISDVTGDTTTISRDAVSRVTRLEQPLNIEGSTSSYIETAFEYDRNGNLAATVDGEGNRVEVQHDQFDRPARIVDPGTTAGTETTLLTYDRNGNLATVTTPRDADSVYRYRYDDMDRLVEEEDPLGQIHRSEYDDAGDLATERTPEGHLTRMQYDPTGLLRKVIDPLGQETTYDYDAHENLIRQTEPGSAPGPGQPTLPKVTEWSHDGRDLKWTETTGTGDDRRTAVTEYDAEGNLRREVNPEGVNPMTLKPLTPDPGSAITNPVDVVGRDAALNATVREYTPDGLLASVHLPWGERDANDRRRYRQDFERDERGRITAIDAPFAWTDVAAKTVRTSYTYYDSGWIKSASDERAVDPGSTERVTDDVMRYAYDRRGLQTSWRSDDGRESTRSYHPNGLLRQRTASRLDPETGAVESSRSYAYRYNKNGSLTELEDTQLGRVTKIGYDPAERRTLVNEDWIGGADTRTVYDRDGNVTKRQTDGRVSTSDPSAYIGGKTTSFGYDALGRETRSEATQAGADARVTTRSYWPSGASKLETKPDGATEESFFASDGRIERMVVKCAGGTVTLKDQTYAYTRNGNRIADERGVYQFNARGQLVDWQRTEGYRAGTHVSYDLDATGNVLNKVDGATRTTYEYEGNRLEGQTVTDGQDALTTDYVYDDFGSIAEVRAPDEVTTFEHDEFERLKSVTDSQGTVSYTYDALDRRDSRTDEEGERWDLSYAGLSESLSLEESSDGTTDRFYDYDAALEESVGQAVAEDNGPAEFRSYAQGAQGTVEGLIAEGGAGLLTTDSYAYDPYGAPESQIPPASVGEPLSPEEELSPAAQDNPIRFQGFTADAGGQVYDMEARAYLAEAGRFVTQDRFEQASSDQVQQVNLGTTNRYAFAGGNPVDFVELGGHKRVADGGGHSKAKKTSLKPAKPANPRPKSQRRPSKPPKPPRPASRRTPPRVSGIGSAPKSRAKPPRTRPSGPKPRSRPQPGAQPDPPGKRAPRSKAPSVKTVLGLAFLVVGPGKLVAGAKGLIAAGKGAAKLGKAGVNAIRGASKGPKLKPVPKTPRGPATSRGSTGRTTPTSLKEKLAMEEVVSNPQGTRVALVMSDARWPASAGWVKMRQVVNGVAIHYVRNARTRAVDDFKFK